MNEEQEQALISERELMNRQPLATMLPVIPQQQQQETNQQRATTNRSKEEISSYDKQVITQGTKQKTTKKASKEGGLKAKKENKEEEKRRKKEKEKEEARRTSVVMSLKEAKEELEELRKAGKARENLVKELKMKLEAETAKFEQEKAKLVEEIQFHKLQTEGKYFKKIIVCSLLVFSSRLPLLKTR